MDAAYQNVARRRYFPRTAPIERPHYAPVERAHYTVVENTHVAPAESTAVFAVSPVGHLLPPPAIDVLDLPIATRLRAMEFQQRQQLFVAHANRYLPPGCNVMAWNILPLDLYQSDLGRFLMIACDFHAYGPGNTMLLPTMPVGAQHLVLPQHPRVVSEHHFQQSTQRISALRDQVARDHTRASFALHNGDMSQVYGRSDSKSKYCRELTRIVENVVMAVLGIDALAAHSSQFGALLAAM